MLISGAAIDIDIMFGWEWFRLSTLSWLGSSRHMDSDMCLRKSIEKQRGKTIIISYYSGFILSQVSYMDYIEKLNLWSVKHRKNVKSQKFLSQPIRVPPYSLHQKFFEIFFFIFRFLDVQNVEKTWNLEKIFQLIRKKFWSALSQLLDYNRDTWLSIYIWGNNGKKGK